MKNIAILFSLFFAVAILASCSGDDAARDAARQSLPERGIVADPIPPTPTVTTTAAASGVQHYICPNSCEGSGGETGGSCPVCGTAYIHNQAYHNTTATTPTTPTQIQTTTTPTTNPTTPAAAKSAAGVWHYSCSAGCGGGAGSAGNCPDCGAALAHNQAYHN